VSATEEATDLYLRRELPDGALIEFEERLTGFRAYWYTGPTPGAKRERLPSVTTILGEIMPKYALLDWYEARGAEAALFLARRGLLDHVEPVDAIEAIRENGMGAKSSAKHASDRGKRIHKILEVYALTGAVPNPADYPEEDRGYIKGLIRWILKADPQVRDSGGVERLVCDGERGYAGRLDLRCCVYGMSDDFIVDLKTNRKARLYPSASLQVAGYHQADVKCGAAPALGGLLVAVGPDGTFADAYVPLEAWDAWDDGLRYYSTTKGMPGPLEVR
jgi:hypothetical protein